ncbi:MAG TPA: fibronectin type III domain-containing protein [Polyangia bacterium]|nr:fibronectin type III domain-containing protein [Polyangia bacterium]
MSARTPSHRARPLTSLAAAIAAVAALGAAPAAHAQARVLFDAAHAQTAGNADWVLDEDTCGIAQRYPTPTQSSITSTTGETYWRGAFSAFGVDVVKRGFSVESLPTGTAITYGNTSNPQDLSNYRVFIIPEPNVRFTTAEKTAIQAFVQNGGGLFMISDHYNSDRNNDGWDSPEIFNDLGAPTLFGISFNTGSVTPNYFDNNPDDNYTVDTSSPIVFTGPYGTASLKRGLGLFGATAFTINPSANASVQGHIWHTSGTPGATTQVTFATATYGAGRVAALGDSSPGEDNTNGCSHTTYTGWNDTRFDNALLQLNAIAWLAGVTGGVAAPNAPTGLAAATGASAGQVNLTWTDNSSAETRYVLERRPTSSTTWRVVGILAANTISYTDTGLTSGTSYTYRLAAINTGGSSAFTATASATAR